MRWPFARPFEVFVAILFVCVFAAHVIRLWGGPFPASMIIGAFVLDTLLCAGMIAISRVPSKAKRRKKASNELDEFLG